MQEILAIPNVTQKLAFRARQMPIFELRQLYMLSKIFEIFLYSLKILLVSCYF
jgi:hypothetical protein